MYYVSTVFEGLCLMTTGGKSMKDTVLLELAARGERDARPPQVEDAKHNSDDLFLTAGCESGWCGG